MSKLLQSLGIDMSEVRNCPDCGTHAVTVAEELSTRRECAKLNVTIPVWTCGECKFAYTDGRGEQIEQDAIDRAKE